MSVRTCLVRPMLKITARHTSSGTALRRQFDTKLTGLNKRNQIIVRWLLFTLCIHSTSETDAYTEAAQHDGRRYVYLRAPETVEVVPSGL